MAPFQRLGCLLEYPGASLEPALGECIEALEGGVPGAAARLRAFRRALGEIGVGRLEEIYTETFDLRADSSLYVGHHLFGADVRRNLLLARLRQWCREQGTDPGTELPDHLAVVLRLLGSGAPPEERLELARDCVLPMLGKVRSVVESRPPSDYAQVLAALEEVVAASLESWRSACP